MRFRVYEFEVGVNDSTFSGNVLQKLYSSPTILGFHMTFNRSCNEFTRCCSLFLAQIILIGNFFYSDWCMETCNFQNQKSRF